MPGEHDEDLTVGRVRLVGPSRADRSAHERHRGELRLEVGEVGPALTRALGIAALGHEVGDHAVEVEAVVEPTPDQGLDAFDMVRRKVGTQHDLHGAAGRQLQEQMIGLVGGDLGRSDNARNRLGNRRRLGGDQQGRERQQQQRLHNPPRKNHGAPVRGRF